MAESDFETKWQLLVADTWDDEELKKRLLDNPAAVLKERGIDVPEGLEIKVHADSESVEHLVLPEGPVEDEGELEEEELESVAGGGCPTVCRRCGGGRCFRCGGGRCFRCGGGRCFRCGGRCFRCGGRCRCR